MSATTTPAPHQAEPSAAAEDATSRPFQVNVLNEDLAELPQQPVLE